jgi:hypothetical protein
MSARYPRVIEWSEDDHCWLGSAPPLVGQCCHGATEAIRIGLVHGPQHVMGCVHLPRAHATHLVMRLSY